MKIAERTQVTQTSGLSHTQCMSPPAQPSFLHLVTASELEDLRNALGRTMLPTDFRAKLKGLSSDDLTSRFIEQNCRLFVALLLAAQDGTFNRATVAERERLLRVLAYVRKDDDYTPDYRRDGFADDRQEIRAVVKELSSLLDTFKSWRLRHQVPGMWRNPEPLRVAPILAI